MWNLIKKKSNRLGSLNFRRAKCKKAKVIWNKKYAKIVLLIIKSLKNVSSNFLKRRGRQKDWRTN